MAQQGRIGGPLLADNLLRNGSNLAINTKVLYLDVVNKRVGFNTTTPVTDLYSPNNIGTTNLIASGTVDIGNWLISGSRIQYVLNAPIIISPNQSSNPRIITSGLSTDNLYVYGNTFSSYTANSDINISPNGTAGINFANQSGTVQVTVNNNLHATGDITWDGNVTLGNANTDTITFAAGINSDIIPVNPLELYTPISEPMLSSDGQILLAEDGETLYTDFGVPFYQSTPVYNLGSAGLEWNNLYARGLYSTTGNLDTLTAGNMISGDIQITGNTIKSVNSGIDLKFKPTLNTVLTNSSIQLNNYNIENYSNSVITLSGIANGYFKFSGANGLVIPEGDSTTRQITPEPGTTRFNTDISTPEVYDATAGWIPVNGTQPVIQSSDVNDIADIWALVLGL